MPNIKIFLLILITALNVASDYAQNTDSVLHHMYWNYRERFKKYFTTIGGEQGQSIVSDRIFNDHSVSQVSSLGWKLNSNRKPIMAPLNSDEEQYWGYKNFGDATLDYDYYMGTLATEYWLLKYYHHDEEAMNAVKNELYFALNALDRLDKYSKLYFEGSPTTEIDGFFVRDDSEPKVTKYLEICNYPKVQFVSFMLSINQLNPKFDR